ncbi:MAG: Pyruvate flavodoxin/ferredoxin oxidoreductase domain protein [Acetothermia bacterium 64_32]|nr:MAG: Pyruvate flavodoxin/ferredoxin oxidoreductase domain protein [Acetothermia bacterium 64_32]HAF70156.1 pyruvate ferredoxin oxidoreductase [Candidatus Acetothermia bacterium]
MKKTMTGHKAVAEAMRQIEPDVVAVYPITPQSEIAEYYAQYVHDGLVHTELVPVESEHSAMSACVGAAAAGARVMTATASQGLALMIEVVYIAASMRLPIVMALANRALSGPINIHCDHSDAYLARDAGAVHIFAESAQEAYDWMIMAQRIAEHEKVRLPVVVNLDGFTLTHSVQVVEPLPDEEVKRFVGEFKPLYPLLDVDNPSTWGPFAMPDYYFELKRAQQAGMEEVPAVFLEVQEEYRKLSGRPYRGFFEAYKLDDAERAIVIMGSTAGTAKVVVDELRKQGEKVGLLKVWLWRPFPREEVVKALSHVDRVAVLDRALSFGNMGALYLDITSAFVHQDRRPGFVNYIYGLGGRDTTVDHIHQVFEELESARPGELRYLGLRE